MLSAAKRDHLQQVFQAVRGRTRTISDDERATVLDAVHGFVDAMKREGRLPEVVIIEIRSVAMVAGVAGYRDPLLNHVMRVAISRYFDETHRGEGRSSSGTTE